jgi:hypothetical protein
MVEYNDLIIDVFHQRVIVDPNKLQKEKIGTFASDGHNYYEIAMNDVEEIGKTLPLASKLMIEYNVIYQKDAWKAAKDLLFVAGNGDVTNEMILDYLAMNPEMIGYISLVNY